MTTPENAGETTISVTFTIGSMGQASSEEALRHLVDDLKDRFRKSTALKTWGVQLDRASYMPWDSGGEPAGICLNEKVSPGTPKVTEG